MKKTNKPSFAAVLMYCIIGAAVLCCAVCFLLYYTNILRNLVLLWTGVTCFTTIYHLSMRLVMGVVSNIFRVNHNQWWFREKNFEAGMYKLLRVKNWKGKALTFRPDLYDTKNRTLTQIADTTAKSELDHWINVLISVSTLCFALIWGQLWIFALTAFFAALFDSQFILIQRYNRPRLVKLISKQESKVPVSTT